MSSCFPIIDERRRKTMRPERRTTALKADVHLTRLVMVSMAAVTVACLTLTQMARLAPTASSRGDLGTAHSTSATDQALSSEPRHSAATDAAIVAVARGREADGTHMIGMRAVRPKEVDALPRIAVLGPRTAFPVVASPSFKMCDLWTAYCVKFTKSETKKVNDAMFVSLGAATNTLCGYIPMKGWGVAIKAVCHAAIAAYFLVLRNTFNKARKQGRCVELKWGIIGPAVLRGWKVVSC
jgi:hypothetical protein